MKAVRSFTVRPLLPEPIAALDRLAGNLRWSWHRETRHVFAAIDNLWKGTSSQAVQSLNLMFGRPETEGIGPTALAPAGVTA